MHPDDERDQREVDRALEALDVPMPELSLEAIVAKAGAPREEPARVRHEGARVLQRAAALVVAVLVVGAAAYAIPGSPVRRWLDRVFLTRHEATIPLRPASPAPDDGAGVAVDPGTNLVIEFRSAVPSGEAVVTFTDGEEVGIRASAGAATFTFEHDRVVVAPRGAGGIFHVEVPRTAPRVEIRVAGRSLFLAQAGRSASPSASSGERRIPLGSP